MRSYLPVAALALLVALPCAAADQPEDAAVKQVVLDAYVNGVHASPDAAAMRRGFHPDFRMLVLSDGKMNAVTLDEWAGRIEKSAAAATGPRPKIDHEFTDVDVVGSAATVRVEISRDGRHTFTDFLSLYRFADGWKIVGKTFYAHPRQ